MNQVIFYVAFSRTVINREKAKMLALSGVQLAMSKLSLPEKKETKENKAQSPDVMSKKFLEKILPIINRWEIISLKEKTDNIDAEIKICIVCENGKININKLYDFNTHKFVGQESQKGDMRKWDTNSRLRY